MIEDKLRKIYTFIPDHVAVLAVSKGQSLDSIREAYGVGQRDFGENYIQELKKKYECLPKDIQWHMIGKLQSNKIKYIVPFIHLIHSIEDYRQLEIINKYAIKYDREIHCLLQIKISPQPNKSGMIASMAEKFLNDLKNKPLKHIRIKGLMGISSFEIDDKNIQKKEFDQLASLFNNLKKNYKDFTILSMGMSSDYNLAIEKGATLIRLGSSIFGDRKNKELSNLSFFI